MDPQDLLERMASISPGVRVHIEGRLYLENVDEDEITHQILVNECFALMINEAHEIGIEFFCTMSDLCESLYVMDKTLLLFEVLFPTPLYRSITESDSFKTMISSVILDGVDVEGESSVNTILEHLALYNPNTEDVFLNTYIFFQDKLKSTPVFDAYVKSFLENDDTPFVVEVDQEIIKNYLVNVEDKFRKLLKAADLVFSKLTTKDDLYKLYDSIDNYKVKASDHFTLEEYSWAYNAKLNNASEPKVQIFIEKYKIQFESSVPFYEDFFILRGDPVTRKDIVTLVLGAYLETNTRDAFLSLVSDVFDKLKANNKIITDDMNMLIQNLNMIIVQEYYP